MRARPDGPTVTVVHTWACHFGAEVQEAFTQLLPGHGVTVDLVDATEPRGQALLERHHTQQYPLILVDGEFFSAGRLPHADLIRTLRARVA